MSLDSVPTAKQRGDADLRGAAGRVARSRAVRRALRVSGCKLCRAERAVRVLVRAVDDVRHAEARVAAAEAATWGTPPLAMRPRTTNALFCAMAVCDWTVASAAFRQSGPAIDPLTSFVFAGGIGLSVVVLAKKGGERLATFRRLDDQAARWPVLAAIAACIVMIASVGLTLLRVAPFW